MFRMARPGGVGGAGQLGRFKDALVKHQLPRSGGSGAGKEGRGHLPSRPELERGQREDGPSNPRL